MFGKVAKLALVRSWSAAPVRPAEAEVGIAPLQAPAGNPRELFFEVAEQVAREERIPAHEAMAKVRAERPGLFWAAFPNDRSRPSRPGKPRVQLRSQMFEQVAEIARRECIPEHLAMGRARAEHPELMSAWA